jgi:nicotinamidase/pyrazinamidase
MEAYKQVFKHRLLNGGHSFYVFSLKINPAILIGMKTCLIIVDSQNDFVEGGALAVAGGKQTCSNISRLLKESHYDTIVVTEDFHPADHCSFKPRGGMWPEHCVQHTYGAQLQEDIASAVGSVLQRGDLVTVHVVHKGTDPHTEEYGASVTADNTGRFDITGIALDYCVLETAKLTKKRYPDARVVVKSAYTAAVDGSTENKKRVTEECRANGIEWEE